MKLNENARRCPCGIPTQRGLGAALERDGLRNNKKKVDDSAGRVADESAAQSRVRASAGDCAPIYSES